MKRLDTSPITPTIEFPVKSGTLDFLQDATKEALQGLISNLISNPVTGTMYVLSGCVNTGSGSNYIISDGYVYYNGEIYQVNATTFTLGVGESAFADLLVTQYLTNADPVTFTDGVARNVHNIRSITIKSEFSSAYPLYSNLVFLSNLHPVVNKGYIELVRPAESTGFVGTFFGNITAVTRNLSSASAIGTRDMGFIITLANPMVDTNYIVKMYIETKDLLTGSVIVSPITSAVYEVKNTSSFAIYFKEAGSTACPDLRIHIRTEPR